MNRKLNIFIHHSLAKQARDQKKAAIARAYTELLRKSASVGARLWVAIQDRAKEAELRLRSQSPPAHIKAYERKNNPLELTKLIRVCPSGKRAWFETNKGFPVKKPYPVR